ncbi:response regulator transcription factor [Sulfurimonas marina]|uniref:Response regulator transcription factor n=1 Tax=Sulfurimonas marina TaxID=2590551 RepID=A0A7M1AUG8_9BACT|nr:response regulator [Sulfurimonas marina]QOP41064.1 response regulator transcription factor [Sulfurimonas marina]
MKVLIVDENKEFTYELQEYFMKKSIEIDILNSYDKILEEYNQVNLHEYDSFIFEIDSENQQGLDILDYMNILEIDKPVIFISQEKSVELLSKAFAMGGEDFISKPFHIKELELRMLKGIRKKISKDEIELPNEYTYIYSEYAVAKHHSYIDMTKKQRQLLYLLITNKNNLVTYSMISDYVYNGKEFSNNAIATHIRDIRKKLPGIPIKAVKGDGYILKV